jgi:nitrate reductase beta subunit
MNIKAQIGMVLNLDKCIGCHTCSVACKQVWTSREGAEYMWWNNVETKPGVGYPKRWEDQDLWQGGWVLENGKIRPRQGSQLGILSKIFGNPKLPELQDYYTPYNFDYAHLQTRAEGKHPPTARPFHAITKQRIEKITQGPNWEDDLAGPAGERLQDPAAQGLDHETLARFEESFMMYLPRLCEHCINPTCAASCPSGAIYKREEDGIVLVDQEKCRGWRMCVSGCPYKKVYFNWKTGKAEKCIFCYPRIESGQPTLCAETCVGRMRYLGVLLYDADRVQEVLHTPDDKDMYEAQKSLFLDPSDPKVIEEARKQGIPESWLEAAQNSPVYKLAVEWELALPLHPEYRTLPMVWYVPTLSPIKQHQAALGHHEDVVPDVSAMRIPIQYLANLMSAGDPAPVERALNRMTALRRWKRALDRKQSEAPIYVEQVGLNEIQAQEMYSLMALARYEDRFVIPTSHKEYAEDAFAHAQDMDGCGFSDGHGCHGPQDSGMHAPQNPNLGLFGIQAKGEFEP